MTTDALLLISEGMAVLDLNYAFIRWEGAKPSLYFVGEYQEYEPAAEDGLQEADFILTGFTRGSWLELEEAKQKIENYFYRDGKTTIAPSGNAVVFSYANSYVIPTADAELKKIEIHLNVKEWKVN